MAIVLTAVQSLTSDTDATSYTSTSFTPTAYRLLVAFIFTRGLQADPTSVKSGTSGDLTWDKKAAINLGATDRLMVYTALSGVVPTAGGLVATYAGTQTGQQISIFSLAGADMSGGALAAIVQAPTNSGTATSGSVTLATVTRELNLPMSAFGHSANEAAAPRTNWTEVHDVVGATPAGNLETQWRSDIFETTASATWTSNVAWVGVAIEVAAATGTITTDFTTIDAADVTTAWLLTIANGTWATAPVASNDIFIQGGNSLVGRASFATSAGVSYGLAATSSNLDLTTGNHVFFWIRCTAWAATSTKAKGGARISISSDVTPTIAAAGGAPTNSSTWYVGGSDTDITTGWVCYVINPNGTADLVTGSPVISTVNRAGIGTNILSTVGAGSFKPWDFSFDLIKYGTGFSGATGGITDGTGQSPVVFKDIYAVDSLGNAAYGVITLSSGIFYLAGKLRFGKTNQSAETVFKDTSKTLVWQDFNVASGFYEIEVVGNSTGPQNTTFQLGNYTFSSNLTSAGCTIKGAGNVSGTVRLDGVAGLAHSIWKLTASDANQVTKLYNSNFSEMLSAALAYNAVSIELTTNCTTNATTTLATTGSFITSGIVAGMKVAGTNIASDTYVSSIQSATSLTMDKAATGSGSSLTMTFTDNNQIRGCTFVNSGAITTNGCVIDSCTFQDVKTGAPISATYALIVASPTEGNRITNSKLISCNIAIKITATGTYTFDNLTFSGNTYDVENSSAGVVTINATNGANPVTHIETGGGSTVINNAKTITVTVKDSNNVAVQSAQVWIQKDPADTDFGHEAKPFTSAAGNNAGDADFVVSETLPSDLPSSGWINVTSSGRLQSYRYVSKTGSTFTLRTGVTGTDNGSGTTTTISETGISAKDIVEGDTIRMTASPKEWAIVLSNTGDVVTTTATSGGTSWAGKAYSVHTLAMTYQQTTDKATVPLMNEETNGSGVATESYNYGASKDVIIRVRKASSGTKYLPFSTTGTITGNFSLAVSLTTDTIA